MHSVSDLFMCLGGLSGHVGRHSDRFVGGYCIGQRNL